jgi:hypothetical protein
MTSQATHVESQPTAANYADISQGIEELSQKNEEKPERHRTVWQTNYATVWAKLDELENKA